MIANALMIAPISYRERRGWQGLCLLLAYEYDHYVTLLDVYFLGPTHDLTLLNLL